jgi:hypothetical protein
VRLKPFSAGAELALVEAVQPKVAAKKWKSFGNVVVDAYICTYFQD